MSSQSLGYPTGAGGGGGGGGNVTTGGMTVPNIPFANTPTDIEDTVATYNSVTKEWQFNTARVSIGAGAPGASSALEIISTNKALRISVMTVAQRNAIGAPLNGMIVFCTDSVPPAMFLYNGAAWVAFPNGTGFISGGPLTTKQFPVADGMQTITDSLLKGDTAGNGTLTSLYINNLFGHLVGTTTGIAIAPGAGAGAGATATISGTDMCGTFQVTVPALAVPVGNGVFATVTFGAPYSAAPSMVLIVQTPSTGGTTIGFTSLPFVDPVTGITVNGFTVTNKAVVAGFTTNAPIVFYYIVIQ